MALKLAGYRPTNEERAYELGITKTYRFPAPYGPDGGPASLKCTFKYAGAGNAQYKEAEAQLQEAVALGDVPQEGSGNVMVEILYDTCILTWETNLQQASKGGGVDLKPTRANFIALSRMEIPEIANPIVQLLRDMRDRQNFVERQREEELGN